MPPTLSTLSPRRSASSPGQDFEQEAVPTAPLDPAGAATAVLPVLAGTDEAEAIVCDCVEVPLGVLKSCIARGCTTVDALARATGATTVCGGCVPRVAELVNEQSGVPVRLVGVRRVRPDVRSFRFAATDPSRPLRPHLPGQHVVVSGVIEGQRVSRSYTLTSVPGSTSVCEITVKREANGRFSSSLFGQGPDLTAMRVSAPRGGFCVDLEQPEPAVFLVGGIGVTPALAVARAVAARKLPKPLHIDYSARGAGGHAFAGDLDRLAARHPSISVRLRDTGEGDRLGSAEVRDYHRRYPGAHFYICGPDSYQEAVSRHLRRAGVRRDHIHVEAFGAGRRAGAGPPQRARDRAIFLLGIVLLAAYLAQAAAGLDWAWLSALQEREVYRRWSGAVLLAFIAAQWVLPFQRLRGWHRAAAAAYPWHRGMGALAPAFFYAHASQTGYGYLLALSSVYLANVAVGLADKTVVRDPELRERYARIWLVPHVVLACLTVGLALFHLVVVFAYK